MENHNEKFAGEKDQSVAETVADSRSSFGKIQDPGLSQSKIQWKFSPLTSVTASLHSLILHKNLDFWDCILLPYFHSITSNYGLLFYKILGKIRKKIMNYWRRVNRWKRKREIELQREEEAGQGLRKNGNLSPKKRMQIQFSDDFPLHPSQRRVSFFRKLPLKRALGRICSVDKLWYY